MKRVAFIWRESIYKNQFRCSHCGAHLADEKTGYLTDNSGFISGNEKEIYCRCCGMHVAHIEEVEADIEPGLRGNWEDFMNEIK